MLDILVPILYYLNDARADQCTFLFELFFTFLLVFLLGVFDIYFFSFCPFSSSWPNAYWRVHITTSEW